MVDAQGERSAGGEIGESEDAEAVALGDEVVVGGIAEGEGEHALLLEIGFGDASEGTGDDDVAAAEADFHGGVLAARAFAVVFVADGDPADAGVLVGAGDLADGLLGLTGDLVQGGACCSREGVDAAAEEVAGDVFEVSAEPQPGAGGRNVVGGGLALGLEEQGHEGVVVAVPGVERGQALEPFALGADDHVDIAAVVGRGDEALVAGIEAIGGQFVAGRRGEAELALGGGDGVRARVKAQLAGEGGGDNEFGRTNEGERVAVGVVAAGEVAIEGGDDCVLFVAFEVFALPLADAGSAGVGEHGRAGGLEGFNLPVSADRRADLFGAGSYEQRRLQLEPGFRCLTGDVCGAAHVFVGRVGAGADQRVGDVERVALGLHEIANLGDGIAQIGGMRSDPGRFQLTQIDFDDTVEYLVSSLGDLVVGAQVFSVGFGELSDLGSFGAAQVVGGA